MVIYSNSLEIRIAADTLSFLFNVVSIIILYETYKYYELRSVDTPQMWIFRTALFLIQFIMIMAVLANYPLGARVVISLSFLWVVWSLLDIWSVTKKMKSF